MNDALLAAAVVIGAYLVGSIPFGKLFARARGVDIQKVGSGNIGATNVARTLGKKLGLLVLVLDALKGAGPMALVMALDLGDRVDPFIVAATGLAAICGHCFPVWLRFRGGKGVATSLGVFLVAAPMVAGLGVGVFAVMYALFRVASLGSITAALSFPILLWVLGRPDELVAMGIAGAIVVIGKHHANIRRLLGRSELQV
jgi:acyl phosphate:glycerol-3-phosphate acyltransferase